MGRQSLILALLLAGCNDETGDIPWFDGPVGAAVLDPSDGGPFDEPVGFVANSRSGTIVPIDVKHVTLLTDQPGAPFLLPRQIATGDERQLDQLAVVADDAGDVNLYASDLANQVLVEAEYLTAGDPYPSRVEPSSSDPVFVDADGSGDAPTLSDVELRVGWTTTEDWSIEYDGTRWWAKGTRSGEQHAEPVAGEDYCTDRRELCFTLEGAATEGDRFELSTDAGVSEFDLGGQILGLARVPDAGLLVAGVWDATAEMGSLVFFDPGTDSVAGRLALDAGAQPWRFAFGDGVIYVADAKLPLIHEVALDADDPSASALSSLDLPAPASALTLAESSYGPRLFVGLSEIDRVDVYDLSTGQWVDVNHFDDETAGLYVHSGVVGLAAAPDPIRLQQTTAWGARIEAPVVAMTTEAGELLMIDADTGCLAQSEGGPTLIADSKGDYVPFTDVGPTSAPAFLVDDATNAPVTINPCGGVARTESWTVTYDGATGGWFVRGTLSDDQQGEAYEETRYVSDDAAVSFTILNGATPPTNGDTFAFSVDDGVLRLNSIKTSSSTSTKFYLPAGPVIFQTDNGPTGGGWDVLDRRTYALVPVTNSDLVTRVRLSSWTAEVLWR